MKKYYTTEQMIDFIKDFDPLTVEFADSEGILEETAIRLSSQVEHIRHLLDRLVLAERVIGELYLMQREYEE